MRENMSKADYENLYNHLIIRKKMDLRETMELFDTSESTARRMFIRLEKDGRALRTSGGIMLFVGSAMDYSFDAVARAQYQEKTAIGEAACSLVQDGDVIYCDAGTTLLCFCEALANRSKKKPLNISVFTNSLANLEALSDLMTVILVGGMYRPHRKDFCGFIAETSLSRLHFTKCFLGADGSLVPKYFSTTDFDTARLNEIVIHNSEKTIVLADSFKFEKTSLVSYAPFNLVHTVVTDSGISVAAKNALIKSNIDVVLKSELNK